MLWFSVRIAYSTLEPLAYRDLPVRPLTNSMTLIAEGRQ